MSGRYLFIIRRESLILVNHMESNIHKANVNAVACKENHASCQIFFFGTQFMFLIGLLGYILPSPVSGFNEPWYGMN